MRLCHAFRLIPFAVCLLSSGIAQGQAEKPTFRTDPITRYVHLTYPIPASAGEEVLVVATWSPAGQGAWKPARVTPLISETGLELASENDWSAWWEGRVIERRAAGLQRTLIWNPFPDGQSNGQVDADLRVEIRSSDGSLLGAHTTHIEADNHDVVAIEDWAAVLQAKTITTGKQEQAGAGWKFTKGLSGTSTPETPLPPLTYPLDLRGYHAIFVQTELTPGSAEACSIRLRLSGDERSDPIRSEGAVREIFWKWARMDRQHVVLEQPHNHLGYAPAQVSSVRLVPLTAELVSAIESQFGGPPDKLVVGYWEPYSWAFYEDVRQPLQHRQPLAAFAEARIGLLDTQIGRVGAKVVYESRVTDPLIHGTFGDPIAGSARPETFNVGRMQQYTNTLETELRYARDLELGFHANFGAGACYVGTPLQGDISKKHPDWLRGNTLRYELPEVRHYALSLFREAMEIGAPGISIDFCRYPEGIDKADTGNQLLRELRTLADEFAGTRGGRVKILVRFPGTGVRLCDRFDYATWAREGLVDFLCPSNIQGRHLHIDMRPYVEAVKGTPCMLLPALDGLGWGQPMPGPFLWRVQQLYEAGATCIYVYQADARVLGRPQERRWMRMLASSRAVQAFWDRDTRERPLRSKGIYISRPEAPGGTYHKYERLRVWTEGIPMGPLELSLDGKVVTRSEQPPYSLGTEDYSSDKVIPPGEHELRVRAADGDSWLEQKFTIRGG